MEIAASESRYSRWAESPNSGTRVGHTGRHAERRTPQSVCDPICRSCSALRVLRCHPWPCMMWGGMRGSLSLALILSIGKNIPSSSAACNPPRLFPHGLASPGSDASRSPAPRQVSNNRTNRLRDCYKPADCGAIFGCLWMEFRQPRLTSYSIGDYTVAGGKLTANFSCSSAGPEIEECTNNFGCKRKRVGRSGTAPHLR